MNAVRGTLPFIKYEYYCPHCWTYCISK